MVRTCVAVQLLACGVAHAAPVDHAALLRQAQGNIQHIIIIMQENRSFDNYFGTYPGANGLPAHVCVPLNPANPKLGCVAPFHDPHDFNAGGPHGNTGAQADLDDGYHKALMDGFVQTQTAEARQTCLPANDPGCVALYQAVTRHDAVGYHTADEIPNYWAYAQHFVLQDQMEEGVRSWSFDSHVDMASEWVADCRNPGRAITCYSTPALRPLKPSRPVSFPWVPLYQLLDAHKVSWKYYVGEGDSPDCDDGPEPCAPSKQSATTPTVWNPAPFFSYIKSRGSAYLQQHNVYTAQFYQDVAQGQLPQVSWIIPSFSVSEHPPSSITSGMEYVTGLVNAVMASPYWANTAIFIAWDDWGGFYDHVVPGIVDINNTATPAQGFGVRVPGLLISAYARAGYIDSAVLSFDSYATFMEDLFAGGARLVPSNFGNPDNRPSIRDAVTSVKFPNGSKAAIGDLLNEFDFSQAARPPLILSTAIPVGFAAQCGATVANGFTCQSSTVDLAWTVVPNSAGAPPFTYHVTRDGAALPGCVVQVTQCTDNPGSGNHLYRIYSVDKNGVTSPLSAAVEADVK